MELIDFAERQNEEAAKFSLATLEQARQRCHQLLVLLLGGAAALAGVSINQWGVNGLASAMALCVSLWWFGVAAWLVLRGLRTRPVRSWTYPGVTVLDLESKWQKYAQEVLNEGGEAVDVLLEVRRSALRVSADSANEYRTASEYASAALDQAYTVCALTPLPLALVSAVYALMR